MTGAERPENRPFVEIGSSELRTPSARKAVPGNLSTAHFSVGLSRPFRCRGLRRPFGCQKSEG